MLKGFVSGEEKDIKRIPMKGKNLADLNDVDKTYLNLHYTTGDDMTIVINGTKGNGANVHPLVSPNIILPAGVYTVKAKMVSGSITNISDGMFFGINKDTYARRTSPALKQVGDVGKRTFTLSEDTLLSTIDIAPGYGSGGSTWDNATFECWLYSGSDEMDYEPYGYQEGWEVRDNQDRLIWGREDELQTTTGTIPFKGYGLPVKVKSLLGNGQQSGTPTPASPITPDFCGARTGNLFPLDVNKLHVGRIENDGTIDYEVGTITVGTNSVTYQANEAWRGFYTDYIRANENEKLTFSPNTSSNIALSCSCYDENGNFLGKAPAQSTASIRTFTTLAGTKNVRISVTSSFAEYTITNPMLNLGSTPLPYEPYGWKIPFENHGENLWDPSSKTANQVGQSAWGVRLPAGKYTITNNSSVPVYWRDGYDSTQATTFAAAGATVSRTANNEMVAWSSTSQSNIMLTTDSEAKPYSPYFNETVPVYLGQTPTLRRVKKLVLTGEETIVPYDATYSRFAIIIPDSLIVGVRLSPAICSHYPVISDGRSITSVPNNAIYSDSGNGRWFVKTTDITTVADFKAYIAAQYAAGTPVTVWYVLAEPETGIVNEPLCKIGDYADELNDTVATLPEIPTTTGQNTLTVDTTLAPYEVTIKGHIRKDDRNG